jgi:hypothetical protein
MGLGEDVHQVRWALQLGRSEEIDRIAQARQRHRVLGVLGEAEVGKTETVRQAIGPSTPGRAVIELDLDGAASGRHVSFFLVRQIARAHLGAPAFSILKVGVLVPASIEAQRIELGEILGVEGLEEAFRDWPSGTYPLGRAVAALERFAGMKKVVLWIDHLEAPGLTPRHPLDLDRLLWGFREMLQRVPRFSVVLSGRVAGEARAIGSEAAFHQQGQWLSLDNPGPAQWRSVAANLSLSESSAGELATLTKGHPATMLLALLRMVKVKRASDLDPFELVRELAATDPGLAARSMQHARSLHRLGGQVLMQVANGEGPYAANQRGQSPAQEIRKVLGRLQLAGLIRHDEGWSVVNPLLAAALRGEIALVSAPDLKLKGGSASGSDEFDL